MKRIVLAVVITCLSGAAFGQVTMPQEPLRTAANDYLFDTFSHIRLGRGDLTWSGAVTLNAPVNIEGADDTTFNFWAAMGFFVTDYVEIEGVASWMDTGDASGATIALGANRYFGELADNLFPYIGASASTSMGDFDSDAIGLQLKVGARHYMTDNMGLRYWAQFNSTIDNIFSFEGVLLGYVGIFAHPY